jgi:hypothetical protein
MITYQVLAANYSQKRIEAAYLFISSGKVANGVSEAFVISSDGIVSTVPNNSSDIAQPLCQINSDRTRMHGDMV